jgi:hypothetical protein
MVGVVSLHKNSLHPDIDFINDCDHPDPVFECSAESCNSPSEKQLDSHQGQPTLVSQQVLLGSGIFQREVNQFPISTKDS